MTQLVICEKPSVAADVAKALPGPFERTKWGYRSPQVWVTAAAGHLVAELPPDRYDDKWKEWSYETLPILPEQFRYQPRDQFAAGRLKELAALARDPAVTEIVNACDAGREGELIFKLILQYARLDPPKPIKRAWFSSMTSQAIQEAFANLRPDREMWPLEAAARCRSEADWYVGMNATRAASCQLRGRLSLGRVQTPTLAFVVRRDLEIENFEPEEYFTVEARFGAQSGEYSGLWRPGKDKPTDTDGRIATRPEAKAVATAARMVPQGVIDSVETRRESVAAPRLFDLTALQREANKRFGMSAASTLEAAQRCYETHKVLSYPRTDSSFITQDMAPLVPQLLKRLAACDPRYAPAAQALAGVDPKVIVNDAKVTDHHAIIPTDSALDLSGLNVDDLRIFELVSWRFLAALSPAQILDRTVAWTRLDAPGGALWFRSAGRVEIDPGWRRAWPDDIGAKAATTDAKAPKKSAKAADDDEADGDDGELPALSGAETVKTGDVTVTSRFTKAPSRFSEASLLGVMSTAGKFVDDDELADAMKDSGLGTPATRASIIERLLKVGYLERDKRHLLATAKGRGLIMALGEHPLAQPDLTGSWESRLRNLERCDPAEAGALRAEFIAAVRSFTTDIVAGFVDMTPDMLAAGRRQMGACPTPECGGNVVEGSKGWGCDSYKSREETGCGFVLWRTQGGKRLSDKQMLAKLTAYQQGTEPIPSRQRVVLGPCPTDGCGHEITERVKSWGCTSWRGPKDTGCGYVIWKTNPDGAEVTSELAAEMLARGESNARGPAEVFASCPLCDGNIVDRPKSWSCDSYKGPRQKGCGLTIWKESKITGTVTAEAARAQLDEIAQDPDAYRAQLAARAKPRRKS